MYQFYQKGISPREFKKIQAKDINAMIAIDQMNIEKANIEKELGKLRGKR